MKLLLILLSFLSPFILSAQQRDASFESFWSSFRSAVLEYDMAALDNLVTYPVSTRGPMDYDPVKKVNKDKFKAVLEKYMAADAGTGRGTHKEEIVEKELLPDSDFPEKYSGYMRVGDMQFKKSAGKWKLYWLYTE